MAYTTIDKPSDYFDTVLYTGNAGTLNITSLDFQPDWIWGKDRSGDRHFLADSVRGKKNTGYHLLCSNNNQADTSNAPPDGITAIGSNGFTLGANLSNTDGGWSFEINESPDSGQGNSGTYVAWNWKAGTSVSGNTGGSGTAKTYTGSVNTDAGFSIIRYIGNSTAGHTIPHHLGTTPAWIICRTISAAKEWDVYHHKLASSPERDCIVLNTSAAAVGASTAADKWNNTLPTSSVVTLGDSSQLNTNDGTCIMYAFAEKKGYSKFGSYTGNGNADGTFIYTGFKPAWVLFKRTSSTSNWSLFDNKRNTFNITDSYVQADTSSAEQEFSDIYVDFLSNGIKQRGTNISLNSSGDSFIYMAFAENPFVTSSGVPATAR